MKPTSIVRAALPPALLAALAIGLTTVSAAEKISIDPKQQLPGPNNKAPDSGKPVKVFILMGQSNMVGMGRIAEGKNAEGSLENAVKAKKKYPYLVDEGGNWSERKDVRYVRVMQGRGGGGMQQFNNEWMTVKTCRTIGPEFGIAHVVGDAIDAPVLILKSCIGNRSLGWDLLPPGSERYQAEVTERNGQKVTKVFAGYKDRPDSWVMDQSKGTATEPPPWLDKNGKPIDWYAGKQYDDDTSYAKKVLAELDKYYPGAQGYEVTGFFFWQGEKDCGNAVHAARYEQNLVRFIKQLRKDFNAPDAKFVLATLGEATKGSGGNGGMVLEAQLVVDGKSGKYPEFKGNVATVYSNPMAQGGSGNGHYGGKAEVYMDVGEAMGKAMVDLLENKP
ncbi:MAG: sialate O-acetylesterase [Planctomycetes bacterium]|nr:sialate O-acetylesterase [Planctomycetota bacterium]